MFIVNFGIIIPLAALILSKLGRLGTEQQITEGIGIQTASQINKILKKTAGQSSLKVDGMHLVKDSQTKHILALGSTGSGKTNLFHTILPQVRNQNQAAFVLDHTGELIDRYFQEGDIIFNPLDPKSHAWDFGQELSSSGRLDLFARSLFCYKKTTDEIWGNSSRQLFIDSFNLIKNQGGSLKDLYTFLTQSSLSEMKEARQHPLKTSDRS